MLRWSVKDGGLFGRHLADSYCMPGFDWLIRAGAAQFLIAVTFGIAAMIGLIRRRDWGRKFAIVALLGFSLFNLIVIVSASSAWLWRSGPRSPLCACGEILPASERLSSGCAAPWPFRW